MGEKEGVFSGRYREAEESPDLCREEPVNSEKPAGLIQEEAANSEKPAGLIKKLFAGIGLSILMLGGYLAAQLLAGAAIVGAMAAELLARESGMDLQYAIVAVQRRAVTDPAVMALITAASTVIPALIVMFLYWFVRGRKRTAKDKAFFGEKVLRGSVFLMITIAAVGLYYLAVLISGVINMLSPQTVKEYEEMMEFALGGNTLLILFVTSAAAPVAEECLLRGLVLRNLQKYFQDPTVIIIQAVLFGIFHLNWVQGIYVIPVGAALGFTAVRCRSVLPCIYMHMFYNLMSMIILVLPAFFRSLPCCVMMPALCAGLVWYIGKWENGREGFGM